jgi:hypothetical protein
MNLKNITATCCGEQLSAPGRAVECPKCGVVYQVRETADGNIVLTTTPRQMPQRISTTWWRAILGRLPIIGRRFRAASVRASVHLELP